MVFSLVMVSQSLMRSIYKGSVGNSGKIWKTMVPRLANMIAFSEIRLGMYCTYFFLAF